MTHCKNCGTDFDDNYCPHCGQSATVKRLTFRSVFIESVWDIVSLDTGIFYTMCMLVTKPWKVISEYIHGRRVSYTKPVQLALVTIMLTALVGSIPGLEDINADLSGIEGLDESHEGFVGAVLDGVIRFLGDSQITQEFLSSLIAAFICWLIYLPFGSRRFNLVEYCCAYFYWSSMANTIRIVCSPLKFINENLCSVISIIWLVVLSAKTVFHAFPIRRRWLRVTMFCITSTLLVLTILLILVFLLGAAALLKEMGFV